MLLEPPPTLLEGIPEPQYGAGEGAL